MHTLNAGAGEAEILFPEELFPTPGENYTGVHDNPYAHAICMEQENDGRDAIFVILTLDLVNYSDPGELRRLAVEKTGAEEKNILIHCNHTLSTPHGAMHKTSPSDELYDQKYRETIKIAAGEALRAAKASIRPAKIGFGTAFSYVNVSRIAELKDGVWQGTNEGGLSDHTIPVICLSDNSEQKPIAILYAVNMAAGVLEGSLSSDGGRLVSADIAGASSHYLREIFPGAVCAYCIGASGDQWQALRAVTDYLAADGTIHSEDRHEDGFVYCDGLGRRLASSITEAVRHLQAGSAESLIRMQTWDFVYDGQKELGRDFRFMQPGTDIVFEHAEDVHSDVSIMTIGNIAVVAAHAEIDVQTLMNIRTAVNGKNIFFMEFTNGDGGYMTEKYIYDACGYQCRKSRFYRGSAEKFEQNVIGCLKEI